MTVLLVAGSRTLLAHRDAETRVRIVVAWLIETRGVGTVLHGAARGPDWWADAAARDWVALTSRLVTVMPHPPRPGEHPLGRNARLVREASEIAHQLGCPAVAVGFVDPASHTRGTDHTLGLAARAGLETLRLVWSP